MTGPRVIAYLPFAPLLDASGLEGATCVRDWRRWPTQERLIEQDSTFSTLAELVGTSYRQVLRWRHGGIPIDTAEDAAFALGLHPFAVWGDEWLFACLCPLAPLVRKLAS